MASLVAMEAGATFIKTSTGKVAISSTPEAIYVMSQAIKVKLLSINVIIRNSMKKIIVRLD